MDTSSKTAPLNASDETLVQQFKDGNREAFDALFERYLTAVYRRVRFAVPAAEVEDVTQEVFIAAHDSLRRFRGEAQFSSWLRRLTRNKISDFYRKRSRMQEPPVVGLHEASRVGEGSIQGRVEEHLLLQHAMMGLSERHLEVISLRIIEGLHFVQVAEAMGQSIEATKSLFRRAIVELGELLSKETSEEPNE